MLIDVLIIVIGAFVVATIEYVESVPLAIILQVIFNAASDFNKSIIFNPRRDARSSSLEFGSCGVHPV